MKHRLSIRVSGPSGSGKITLLRQIAKIPGIETVLLQKEAGLNLEGTLIPSSILIVDWNLETNRKQKP